MIQKARISALLQIMPMEIIAEKIFFYNDSKIKHVFEENDVPKISRTYIMVKKVYGNSIVLLKYKRYKDNA